mmetsp:Transcript_14075/g.30573  ORF Transcript_14075/g.30573 Transcript_14075/m.30573 type:complete len:80 (+) Transcript_14075:889-1128(+)
MGQKYRGGDDVKSRIEDVHASANSVDVLANKMTKIEAGSIFVYRRGWAAGWFRSCLLMPCAITGAMVAHAHDRGLVAHG